MKLRTINEERRQKLTQSCTNYLAAVEAINKKKLNSEEISQILEEWNLNIMGGIYFHFLDFLHYARPNRSESLVMAERLKQHILIQEICEEVAKKCGATVTDMVFKFHGTKKEHILEAIKEMGLD
mgnify:CR=1 FL=1